MTVVLDEAGMADVPLPIVVQEFRNHGGILYKVRGSGWKMKRCWKNHAVSLY